MGKEGQVINSRTETVPAYGMVQRLEINELMLHTGEGYLKLESNVPILGWTSQIDNVSNDFSFAVGKSPDKGAPSC